MSSNDISRARDPNVDELTVADLALMERLFSNPRLWPDTAKVWIADYVSQNSLLPISQVQGFEQFVYTRGTEFPSNPSDGQAFHLIVDQTNGTTWQFRYNALSSSSYKWEFTGGPPLYSIVAGSHSTTSTSYAGLSGGPTVTVPLEGDYKVTSGAAVSFSSGSTDRGVVSYSVGGAAAADNDSFNVLGINSDPAGGGTRVQIHTAVAASAAITGQYKTIGGSSISFSKRIIAIEPIRVS